MRNIIWIGICLWLFYASDIKAQAWSKEDSVWLSNILSGKETLRLNDETMRAIREGQLLQPNSSPSGKMKNSNLPLPITRDFSEYIRPEKDTSHYRIALQDLPPSVFWLYGPNFDPLETMRYSCFDRDKQAGQIVMPEINGLSFNLAALLSYLFSPTYRQKVKNRKTATAYRSYNNIPSPTIVQKQRAYREAHPEKILSGRYSTTYQEKMPLPDIEIRRDESNKQDTLQVKKQDILHSNRTEKHIESK